MCLISVKIPFKILRFTLFRLALGAAILNFYSPIIILDLLAYNEGDHSELFAYCKENDKMAEKQAPKLSEIYQEINKIYDDIEKGDEPSSSDNIQVDKFNHLFIYSSTAVLFSFLILQSTQPGLTQK